MEQNNQWVEDRLAKLDPEVNPNVTTAFARFEQRRARRKFTGLRTMSVAAVATVCVVTFPAPRAFAQRMIAPCVEACQSFVLGQTDFHSHLQQLFWHVHSFLGLAAPDFTATDSDGANFQLSDYAGKVVLLNFWATWCVPCQKEIPWFAEFRRAHAADGFAVIGISLDEDGWKSVRPFMLAQKINYRVAIGDEGLAKKYGGVESLPQTWLIRRDGIVVHKHVGFTSKSDFEREIAHEIARN
ncbi:MAG: TlpA disulfide reductase family protein [Bryobacteraceae bacterium]